MKLILAADERWGIGRDGGLLCHLPGDLKYFKSMTMGKTVIMKRVTLQSLPGGRGLPGRRNIVMTRDCGFSSENCEIAHTVRELDALLEGTPKIGRAPSELQSPTHLVCRLLLEKKKIKKT